jgi:ATP-dependent DNA ligase
LEHSQRHITRNLTEEIQLDGYRAQVINSDGKLILFSRRRKSFNRQFPLIVEALGDLPENTVIDGEVVALDESGRPDFNMLQNFRSPASRMYYFVFNLPRPRRTRSHTSAADRASGNYAFGLEV